MKRIMILVLAVAMMITIGTHVYTEEANKDGTLVLKLGVSQVFASLFSQLSESEKELLRNSEYFAEGQY